MALTEWERENARIEAERRDKDNAKQIRRQTEILQRTEAAQLAEMEHAALIREGEYEASLEAARAAQKAERHAEKAAKLARKQLREQREHNFAMWRQTTVNGAAYEEWANRAVPLIAELNDRDARWSPARDADIEAHSTAVTAELLGRHGLDDPRYNGVFKEAAPTRNGLVTGVLYGSIAFAIIPAILWTAVIWVASWFHADWPWADWVYLLILGLVVAMCWRMELGVYRKNREWHLRGGKECLAEIEQRKAAFEASIPASWQDDSGDPAREQLRAAAATVNSMAFEYTEFRPALLTELPAVPAPVGADGIDEQATHIHALLKEWAPAPAAPAESAR